MYTYIYTYLCTQNSRGFLQLLMPVGTACAQSLRHQITHGHSNRPINRRTCCKFTQFTTTQTTRLIVDHIHKLLRKQGATATVTVTSRHVDFFQHHFCHDAAALVTHDLYCCWRDLKSRTEA